LTVPVETDSSLILRLEATRLLPKVPACGVNPKAEEAMASKVTMEAVLMMMDMAKINYS